MRVTTKLTSRVPHTCGHCHETIAPPGGYRSWKFRTDRRENVRCMKPACDPRPSELTQSKLGPVYDAQQDAREAVSGAETAEAIGDALNTLAEAARDVAGEYESAASEAENFAEQWNERADELNNYADELEGWDGEEFDADAVRTEIEEERHEGDDVEDEEEEEEEETEDEEPTAPAAELPSIEDELETRRNDHMEELRNTAEEMIDNLSL